MPKSTKKHSFRQDKKLLVVLLFCVISLAIGFGTMKFMFSQEKSLRKNILSENADIQQKQISTVISMSGEITNIKTLYDTLSDDWQSSSHWFIYSQQGVVLEKNATETEKFKGMSLETVQKYFESKSGESLDDFFSYINGSKSFSSIVVKDKSKGAYLVCAQFITVDGEDYCVGHAVSQAYIYSSVKLNEHILRLRLLTGGLCALLIICVIAAAVLLTKRQTKIESLNAACEIKNQTLQQLYEKNNQLDNDETDTLTGIYSRTFFDTVVFKLAEKKLDRVRFVLIKLNNYDEIFYMKGEGQAQEIIVNAANVLKKSFENDICARFSQNVFAVAVVKYSPEKACESAMKMLNEQCPQGVFTSVISNGGNTKSALVEAINRVSHKDKITL